MRCRNGHPLTPENSRLEKSPECKGGFRVRCKTCIRLSYRNRYRNNESFRKRARAYSRWFKCGHPEGKAWLEIRKELACQPSH